MPPEKTKEVPPAETPKGESAKPSETVTKVETIQIGGKEYTLADLEKLVSGQAKAVQHVLPDAEAPTGEMLLAKVDLQTNQLGSTLHLRNVTPAELMFLVASFAAHSGGRPIRKLELEQEEVTEKVTEHHDEMVVNGQVLPARDVVVAMVTKSTGKQKTVKRSPVEERSRLIGKYGKARVHALYQGAIPQLPTTFRQAVDIGLTSELPAGPEKDAALISEKSLTSR